MGLLFFYRELENIIDDDDRHEQDQEYETEMHQPLLHFQRKLPPGNPLQKKNENMPAVEHRNRKEVQDSELQADNGHQPKQGYDAGFGRALGDSCNLDGSRQGLQRYVPLDEPLDDVKDQKGLVIVVPQTLTER